MTPEKQRIAIAKACEKSPRVSTAASAWTTISLRSPKWRESIEVPDYLNDLNAMHEARSALTPNRQEYFVCVLDRMLHGGRASDLSEQFLSLHATAAQRAEAFLRTLGKWEES